jgi:hypothetical protein
MFYSRKKFLIVSSRTRSATCLPTAVSTSVILVLRREYMQSASLCDTFTLADTGCYRGSAALSAVPLDVADIGPGASQGTNLGKRPHSVEVTMDWAEEGSSSHMPSPHKKAKGKMADRGVSEAAGSTSRARQKSVSRTLIENHSRFDAAGRGAGMLAAPNAHEVYHEFLPGPSVQQELVVTSPQGELPWIEGSAEEATQDHSSSVVWQQGVVNGANDGEREDVEAPIFRFPKRLSPRQRGLLVATPDDLACRTIRELRCRLCPDTVLKHWADFKRHCQFSEAHPLRLCFCSECGDYFARKDSLTRHRGNNTPECQGYQGYTKEEVQAKQAATVQVHKEFEELLQRYIETNEDIGDLFSQRIKAMFPNSLKNKSRK